jgi:DNA repair protein RadC
MEYEQKNTIRQWAEDERPREKLIIKGRSALSDAELLAILMRSGNREESAVELAQRILRTTENNLPELSRLSYKDLTAFKGMGDAKALSIIAALELGNRRRIAEAVSREKISTSQDAFEIFSPLLADCVYEEFWILLLNRANHILSYKCISEGGMSGTVADPKKIFKIALETNASSMILCHNHPSGNLTPSDQDIRLTSKLHEAGRHLELPVLDHIIIGNNKYFSFADNGKI